MTICLKSSKVGKYTATLEAEKYSRGLKAYLYEEDGAPYLARVVNEYTGSKESATARYYAYRAKAKKLTEQEERI